MSDVLRSISTGACKPSRSSNGTRRCAPGNNNCKKTLWSRFPWKLLKTCSCPSSSSSTTTRVSFFFLKSNLVILGQKKSPERNEVDNKIPVFKSEERWKLTKVKSGSSPIFVSPSKTRMPVGVSPKLQEKTTSTSKRSQTDERMIISRHKHYEVIGTLISPVLGPVLAKHGVHVHPVHLQVLRLV